MGHFTPGDRRPKLCIDLGIAYTAGEVRCEATSCRHARAHVDAVLRQKLLDRRVFSVHAVDIEALAWPKNDANGAGSGCHVRAPDGE